ncbi:hypothetical protein D3C84_1042820 [compost metagenome]
MLLLITGCLVDVEVAFVLSAGVVNVGVVDHANTGISHGAGAAQQSEYDQGTRHVIGLQPVC